MRPDRLSAVAVLAVLAAFALGGCGEDDESSADEGTREALEASEFPAVEGRTLEQLLAAYPDAGELVVSPAVGNITVGRNRFGFGVFEVDRTQVTDADVAIYAAGPDGKASGPFPARVESLETEPAFVARNTAADPDAAKAVYVSDLVVEDPGEVRLLALVRDGGEFTGARLPSLVAHRDDPVPAVGERAPVVHTPTASDVGGDLTKIDTRIPPDTMHGDDLVDVLGERPVVLLFATPALCQSRVCGPVVDAAEQVKSEREDDAAFIHSEIYVDNLANEGPRPQVVAYDLQSEPWLFVIDCEGRIDTRIEGAFSVAELDAAVDRVADGC